MKFSFPFQDPEMVKSKILDELGGRELGKIVDFALNSGVMTVTISKFGTSLLEFNQKATTDGLEYSLEKEKIAFAHRAFKDEVKTKLCQIIKKVGGNVIEA